MRCRRVNQTNFVYIAFDNLTIPPSDTFEVWLKFRNGASTNIASYVAVAIGIDAFNFSSFSHDFVFSAHTFVFESNSNRADFYRFRNTFVGIHNCANLRAVNF